MVLSITDSFGKSVYEPLSKNTFDLGLNFKK